MSIDKRAIVSGDAEIDPTVEIGPGAVIEPGARLHAGVKILANAYIHKGTEVGENTVIHQGAVIGNEPQDLSYKGAPTRTVIGKNNVIRENVTIHRGTDEGSETVVGDNNFLMVQSHLGHNCVIGNNVIIANGALLAGHVLVEDGAFISGNVVFHQFCRVGRLAMIGGFTGVNKDVPPFMLVRGPSVIRGINLVGLRRAGLKREVIREIKDAYKDLFLSEMATKDAITEIKKRASSSEIAHLIQFIEDSKRGICKARCNKEEFF